MSRHRHRIGAQDTAAESFFDELMRGSVWGAEPPPRAEAAADGFFEAFDARPRGPRLYGPDGAALPEATATAGYGEALAPEAMFLSSIDAIVPWDSERVFIFKGSQYLKYSVEYNWVPRSYPRRFTGVWKDMWTNIDAALKWPTGAAYFFKGSQYLKVKHDRRIASDYPKPIEGNWKGLWTSGIDAALMWSPKYAYFFKGDECMRFSVDDNEVEADYPKKISTEFPGLWSRGIDAAVKWPGGHAYVIKGSQYVRLESNRSVSKGYPLPLKGYWHARPWIWYPARKRTGLRRPARGNFPARRKNAIKGSEFIADLKKLFDPEKGPRSTVDWQRREKEVFRQIVRGNVPDLITKTLVTIDLSVSHGGRTITGSVKVMPDYLCIGDDGDYVYMPMDPITAQRVAFELDMNLPTARICNAVFDRAGQISPQRQIDAIKRVFRGPERNTPVGRQQNSTAAYEEHSQAIRAEITSRRLSFGQLVAGHKKDVIIASDMHRDPLRIAFHGFYESGVPFEPCKKSGYSLPHCKSQPSYGHSKYKERRFADYAQGVRLVSDRMIVDGQPKSMRKVLRHPVLSYLLSTEGPIDPPYVPEPPASMLERDQWR